MKKAAFLNIFSEERDLFQMKNATLLHKKLNKKKR